VRQEGQSARIFAATGAVCLAAWAALATPADGQISNVGYANPTSAAATVTWTTEAETDGCVRYGTSPALGDTLCDPRADDDVHYVEVTGLDPETTYFFEVASAGQVDDNGGAFYAFTTAQIGSGTPYFVFGRLLLSDGTTPAVEALVTAVVRAAAGGAASEPLAVLTDADGDWWLNLGNLKDPSDGSVLSYVPGDTLLVDLQAAAQGAASDTTLVSGSSPQDAGTVLLPASASVSDSAVRGLDVSLAQNRPNPFHPRTSIVVHARRPLRDAAVVIYDATGRVVRSLPIGGMDAGEARIAWDGDTVAGDRLPSGIYFYRLEHAHGTTSTRKAVLVD